MKIQCVELNKKIKSEGLVKLTWGNVSLSSPNNEKIYIKPSGVPFETMKEQDISVVKTSTGELLEGLKQSVDTNIHLEIYRNFPEVKSIIHTHSKYATSFAQAGKPIACLGTTHADYFKGDVPISDRLTPDQIQNDYETNIGKLVVKWFKKNKYSPIEKGAILLPSHGVLTFGNTGQKALENAIVLEEVAEMNIYTLLLEKNVVNFITEEVLYSKHYNRKNGGDRYYGQG